ncbi:MAG: hypothetical protein GX612_01410, partial [Bacteroidales bacterium]|nr:hypothetical protein [Bacteroidales bacterium]
TVSIHYNDTICSGTVYNKFGFNYSAQQTIAGYMYYDTNFNHNLNGCDSTTLLSLYIRPFNSIQIKDTICAGEQYDKNNFTISTVSSLIQYTLFDTNTNIDQYNCDSITCLQLTVLPNNLIIIKDTICPGDTYNKHNFLLTTNFTTSGYTVYDTNKNANANFCDSTSILQLYVKPADSIIIYDSICAGNTYNLNGFSINTSPTTSLFIIHDTIKTTDLSGCDSLSILHLVVFPVDSITIVDTICAGVTYTNNGFIFPTSFSTTSNWKYDTLHYQNKYGCDSIRMLKLFVKPVDSTFVHDTICGGSNYTFNGKNIYSTPSISPYTITETQKKSNQYGCDSTIMLFLFVKAVDSIYIYDTICSENNYSLHNFNITSIRTFTAYTIFDTNKNVNINGCDSITILSLYIRPIDTLHIIDSICSGARYTAYGFDKYTSISLTSYTIYDTNVSINKYGCDSLTYLSLTVLPADLVYIYDTICAGQHYNINGFDTVALLTDIKYDISDTNYNINKNGCDSTTILHLTVLPVYISPDPVFPSEDICDKGMDYVFWSTSFGNTIKIPTAHLIAGTYIYYDTLPSSNGCDSMVYFTLRVHPTYEIKTIDDICDNETFIWRGHTFNPPHIGNKLIVYDSLTTAAHHCDSVFVLELTINKNKFYEDTVDLCFDENSNPIFNQYTWQGHKNDTIITNLTIGNTYIIYDSLKTIHGCDSVYKHTLIIHPSYNHSDTLSICETELPYIYGDTIFSKGTLSNVYPIHFTLKSGCDSLVNLHLTVFPANVTTIKDTICSGNHYVKYGFDTLTIVRTTIYNIFDTLHIQNQYTCDSIVCLQLTVLPVDSIHIFDTICSGMQYSDHGFDTLIPYTTKPYSIYDTIHSQNSNGCNAITMLSLYITPVDSIYINDTTYAGVHYTSFGFNIITHNSAFEYLLKDSNIAINAKGCDSITILNLLVLPLTTVIIHDTTCAGFIYAKNEFNINPPLSISAFTIVDTNISKNTNGYDSITILLLMVNPVDSVIIRDSICALEHYNKNGFDTFALNSSIKYIIYDTNYDFNRNGCDSITLLELTVFPKYIIDIYDTICKGDSYTRNGFNIINPLTGSHIFDTTLISSKGCDSIVNLYLIVGPYIQHPFNDTSICPGNSVRYSYKENYDYLWSTHPSFNPILSTDTAFSIQIFQDTTLYIKITDTISYGKVCQLVTSVKIYVSPHFTLNYTDTNACCSDTVEFIVHSSENYVYKWYSDILHTKLIQSGDSSLKYTALKDTVFYLSIVDTIGFCHKDTQLNVKIKPVIVQASLDTLTINGCDMTSIPLPVTNMSDLIVYMKPGAIIINECLNSVSVSWLKDNIISTTPITVKRTYKIANECGMGDTITQFIFIIDTLAPQVGPDIIDTFYICNWNLLNVPAATNANSLIAYGFIISDNCTDTNSLMISHTDSIASNNKHKLIRTYTVTDYSGNSNHVKHIIYISDTIAPTTNNLIDTLNQCDTNGIVPIANTIRDLLDLGFIITDNCLKADSLILHKKDQTFTPNACGGGTIIRSYEIMDSFQNKTIAYHTIEISDTTPPQTTDIITLIYDECDLQKIPPAAIKIKQLSTFGFNISDNCQLDSTLILQKEIISNNICIDSIIRIYNVKDACGNTSIFKHTIIVQDTTLPIVNINFKDTTLYNTCTLSNIFAPATTIDELVKLGFIITDNCTLKQQITLLNENIISSKCSDTIIRTYRIEDLCDNAIEVTYTIYTFDTIKPVISDTIKLEKHADATNCIYYIPDLTTLIRNISYDNCTPRDELIIIQNKAAGSLITKSENVIVTVSDHCGNTNQKEVAVIIEGGLSITATANPTIICQLDSSILKASTEGGYGKKTFIWSPIDKLNTFIDSVVISKAIDTTTYTVIVTDESGCTAQTTVDLYVKPIPNFDLGNDIGVCSDSLYPIILNPGINFSKYIWNTGATSPQINVMKEGTYSVKIENTYHCSSVDSIKIVDLTDFYVRIESLSDFCDKRQTVLKANTIASDVIWSTGEISKEIEITEAGTYYITASEMGCVAKDFFVIDPCQFRIFIPNTITPGDNNSQNDCFYLKIPETIEITSFEITIFDRFGNKVFNSKDLKFEWCGTTSNGGIAHDNVFSYIISIEENGKKYNYRGTILVL